MAEENKQDKTTEPAAGETKKRVDDSWKEQALKEKEELDKKLGSEAAKTATGAGEPTDEFLPPPDFPTFISTMALQALIALGQMENPGTKKKETDLVQAKYNIDLLHMLQAKTTGNLTPEETQYFQQTLYSLQMLFVRVSQGGKK